ncbi:MAG TPA: TetR/AcrR family transcriptional regulator C-terminal domain-containing protein [Thermomicrobiales bacterium]|jgi:TetR/AcrR family tetracycline transcriptional repressor
MALQRETVVREALALLDEVGLEGLTVRRLAARLGVQNPALYWHFKNKQALLDLMAATLLADARAAHDPATVGADWAAFLTALAHGYRRAMLAHRDGARVIAGADLTKSEVFVGFEQALAILQEAGFSPIDAFIGVTTISDYTLGATFEEQADAATSRVVEGATAEGRPLPPPLDHERFPTLAATFATIFNAENLPDHGVGFAGGLDLILAGLRAKLTGRQG